MLTGLIELLWKSWMRNLTVSSPQCLLWLGIPINVSILMSSIVIVCMVDWVMEVWCCPRCIYRLSSWILVSCHTVKWLRPVVVWMMIIAIISYITIFLLVVAGKLVCCRSEGFASGCPINAFCRSSSAHDLLILWLDLELRSLLYCILDFTHIISLNLLSLRIFY